MIPNLNEQPTAIVKIMLFSIGIMLSCNAFSAKPSDKTYATQEALDTEISDRITADTDLQNQIDISTNGLPDFPAERYEAVLKICGNSEPPTLQWESCHYSIGDTGPAGGIVFYVTDGGLHGLEAAPGDQNDGLGAEWGCFGTLTGADATAVGTGAQNTIDILASCSETSIAAELADNYSLNGYTDWFLPSKDELNELYVNQIAVGGFSSHGYWSSSEDDSNFAGLQFFVNGLQGFFRKDLVYKVRVVRAF